MKRLVSLLLLLALLCACAPQAATLAESGYQPLRYGDQSELVSAIQQRLSDLGYYSGKISGNFLDGTRAAVKRFQRDYGLAESGEVDGETEALLMAAEYRTLKFGDDGEGVTRLQEHLITLGYLDTKATGKYRAATQEAVRDFQQTNGLTASGEADVETQRVLFSDEAMEKGAEPTATPDPGADVGDINDVVIVEDGASTADSRGENKYSTKLRRGSTGKEVKEVQTRLTELGFFDGPISGNYMTKTVEAVTAFQTQNGLSADGITGQETWDEMFNSAAVLDASATPRPTPVPTPVPYAVTVDVNNQVTIVYGRDEDGNYTIPVRYMVCSTGMKATPSDVGDWVLSGRKARWAYFPSFGSHAQYWTQINENIAFHSVIYNAVDYMALSKKSYNKLGQRASHGCVRLLVSDSQWVYDNIEKGVTVTITEDLPSDEELRKSVRPPALNTDYMRPVNTPLPTPAPSYTSDGMPSEPLRNLKKGSEGADVYWLQMRLKELGYYNGTVTGVYYSGTFNAVKAFQKANGIYPSGKASVETQEALYASAMATETPPVTETPAPTETVAPE